MPPNSVFAYPSEGRFEIAAAITVWPAVPRLLLKRFNAGDVVAPCFEGLPGNAPVMGVAAGVQDAARVHREVIAVLGKRGVFGEDERCEIAAASRTSS